MSATSIAPIRTIAVTDDMNVFMFATFLVGRRGVEVPFHHGGRHVVLISGGLAAAFAASTVVHGWADRGC
jgi:hypothetical protein